MENKSTSRNIVSLQPITQSNRETTCDSNNVNANLSTNVAAAAAANLNTTDVKQQELYSQVSQQTETERSPQDHTHFKPDSSSLEDKMIRAKRLQDGHVPEDLQHLKETIVGYNNLDSNLDNVTKQVTKEGIDSNKHAAIQHKQPKDAATTSSLKASFRPSQSLVLPASAEDSVRRHYVSPMQQATTSSPIATSAVESTRQQSNAVNNASFMQSEGLLAVVPVEENEVHEYAVSNDVPRHKVNKRVQMIQARRYSCRLYFVVFLVLAFAALITSLVLITKNNKSDGQEQEQETEMTTVLQNMTQLIMSIMGADAGLLNDESSPYAKALTWLLQSDNRNASQGLTSTLAQRFYLASFYFDTTTDDDKWTDCNFFEHGQTCYDLYFNRTAQSWLSDSHECEWAGIYCDYHQQIWRLGLEEMNLVGTIPSSVTKFPFMRFLGLIYSRLEGNISLLSNCHHLTSIYLYDNMLSGDLSSVWQHRKFRRFGLSENQFTGSLSSQIGNLVDIKYLSLYGNELTGTVPSEVGWLNSIYWFDINDNRFRGELPPTMQLWSMIERFDVSGNSLSQIPTFLGQLNTTLQYLDLSFNGFTGTLPDELFHLSELTTLDVSNNELSGTLDARFAQLISLQSNTSLGYLDLSYNHFTESIPTELGLLRDLYETHLEGNGFTGSVPSSLCQNQFLDGFTLSADCAEDDNGQVEVQCDCCTEC